MAITTYSELLTAVANWMNRDDLTDRIPEYIALAEAKLNRTLRVRQMESAGTDTMSSSAITLPTDWLAYKSLWYTSGGERFEVRNVPVQEVNRFDGGGTGMPSSYYIAGSTVTFFPTAQSDYTTGHIYYQKIPALTVSNTTNWLLTFAPDVYLYGTVLEAAAYMKDGGRLQEAKEGFSVGISQLISSDRDVHSGSALTMRAY
jgi:hypothetical protein